MANTVISTLSQVFTMAEGWGVVLEGGNPCGFVVKYRECNRERFLTDEEFTRLGQVLGEVATRGGATAPAVAAIRLLMLTGCRKNEILTLRWEDVALDANELKLPDAKDRRTGGPVVAVGGKASGRSAARSGQSLGYPGPKAGDPHARPQ